ncbi:MAG: 30S ribosomal protein S8 [Armatimonadota bacterium]
MPVTDPIADLLTRIRNANSAYYETVDIPSSRIKEDVLRILSEEGFIKGYQVIQSGKQNTLRVQLKYKKNREKALVGVKRISRPGLRVYVNNKEIPRIFGGLGVVVMSTSKGVMTGRDAKSQNLGGEVLCYAW